MLPIYVNNSPNLNFKLTNVITKMNPSFTGLKIIEGSTDVMVLIGYWPGLYSKYYHVVNFDG